MPIGIDASRAFRKEKTGTEWYSHHIIHEILREDPGEDIILYTDQPKGSGDIGITLPARVRIKHLWWPLNRFWTQGRLSLEMLVYPPDVLFIPAHAIPFVHPARTITTIHDIGFLRYPECYSKKELANLKWSTAYALKKAKHIITISEFSKKEILSFYDVPPDKISVIYLGCDREVYRPKSQEAIQTARHAYNITRPYLISVGRIDKRKNTVFLIEVFGEYKRRGYLGMLVLVGPLGFGSEDVLEHIQTSPYRQDIRLTGWVGQEEKACLIAGADCFLFPSLYEGFGLPTVEAQACGAVVISSDQGSLPEIVSGAGLLCALDSPLPWVTALEGLAQDTARKNDLKEKGFKNIERFDWKNAGAQTHELLTN
jgi:glycosyltransferase involved in cell wall biosynthesis